MSQGHRYSVANAGQLSVLLVFYRGGIPVSPNAVSYRFSERQVYSQSSALTSGLANVLQHFALPNGGTVVQCTALKHGGPTNNERRLAALRFAGAQNAAAEFLQQSPNGNAESGWHSFGQPQQSAPRYNSSPYSGGNNSYRLSGR